MNFKGGPKFRKSKLADGDGMKKFHAGPKNMSSCMKHMTESNDEYQHSKIPKKFPEKHS
jgi:hypothetical protein